MKSTLTICLFIFIALISAEGFAQSGKQVQKAFESEIKKLDKAFERKLEDLEDEYAEEYEKKKQAVIEKLKASQKKAMSEQGLDEAVRLRDLAKEINELQASPVTKSVKREEFKIVPITKEMISGNAARYVWKSISMTLTADGNINRPNGAAPEKQKWTISKDGELHIFNREKKRTHRYIGILTPSGLYAINAENEEGVIHPGAILWQLEKN